MAGCRTRTSVMSPIASSFFRTTWNPILVPADLTVQGNNVAATGGSVRPSKRPATPVGPRRQCGQSQWVTGRIPDPSQLGMEGRGRVDGGVRVEVFR